MAYCTATQLRDWVGLKTTDIPSDTTIEFLRDQMEVKLGVDSSSTDASHLTFMCLLTSGARILRWIAQRSVKNGYIQFNAAGGISVTKSPRELIEMAIQLEKQYEDFIDSVENTSVTYTQFLSNLNAGVIQDIKDVYQSVGNMWDFQRAYWPSIQSRREV